MGFNASDVVPFTQERERIHLLLIDGARRAARLASWMALEA